MGLMYEIFCDSCGSSLGVVPANFIDNPNYIPECIRCPFPTKGVSIKPLKYNKHRLTVNSFKIAFGNKRRGKYPLESVIKYNNKYSLTNQLQTIERVFDRDNDKYHEIIMNIDDSEVKRYLERLSKHRGHGSARQK